MESSAWEDWWVRTGSAAIAERAERDIQNTVTNSLLVMALIVIALIVMALVTCTIESLECCHRCACIHFPFAIVLEYAWFPNCLP
jgi:hypothetical protein